MEQNIKSAEQLTQELDQLVRAKVGSLFEYYGLDLENLLTPLKWKPMVLVIGNYSSGKSTFINELLGEDIQRTGQAPTDDSFTIITHPESDDAQEEVPGSTLVNDERFPFGSLRRFGESLVAHLRLKNVRSPIVNELAIIDTPGMLDSVTEKDRGYDYLGVIGELAKLSDLIILMFDPHKAGTIKETYRAIRGTLPGSTGEDRVIYVLNRIDECENLADLVRSYGTLCWNLSQMTGRKDIPRIYLTFAPVNQEIPQGFEIWMKEREELKKAVSKAPRMRLNHILQEVDRVIRELALQVEAMATFKANFMKRLKGIIKIGALSSVLVFLLGDLFLKLFTGFPDVPLIGAILTGSVDIENLLLPAAGALLSIAVTTLYVQRLLFPKYVKQTLEDVDSLVTLDTAYKKDLWERAKERTKRLISQQARKQIWMYHSRNLAKIGRFLEKELGKFYSQMPSS